MNSLEEIFKVKYIVSYLLIVELFPVFTFNYQYSCLQLEYELIVAAEYTLLVTKIANAQFAAVYFSGAFLFSLRLCAITSLRP